MENEMNFNSICKEFARILGGEGKINDDSCSVSLHRTFQVKMLGKNASSSLDVSVKFQDLDDQGYAINFAEIATIQEEVPNFVYALISQGITVSAIHNHWLFTDPPQIMYVHCQSIEHPIQFAKKMANAFSALESLPIS